MSVSKVDPLPSPSDTSFHVATDWATPDFAVVTPAGEMDLHSAGELRDALLQVIDVGARAVVVDLEGATFIDSMTLGVLLGAVRRLQQHRGELRIACADPNIRRIFEITLLDRVFAIYPTRDIALAAAREAP